MGSELRKQQRVRCYAKVLFAETMTPGYVRDMSATGCQISFVQPVPAGPNDVIELSVVAGGGTQISPFTFHMLVRWAKNDGIYFAIGGDIHGVSSETEEGSFAKLVSYYQGEA
jgi:hypothetical protein